MNCILTQYGNQLHAGSGLELSGLEAAIKPFELLFLKTEKTHWYSAQLM